MNWAQQAIDLLAAGQSAVIYPRGSSMRPRVESGDRVVLSPLGDHPLHRDDVVLVTVCGHTYLHKVMAIQGDRVLIGNNRGGTNGWTSRTKVHGIAVEIGG